MSVDRVVAAGGVVAGAGAGVATAAAATRTPRNNMVSIVTSSLEACDVTYSQLPRGRDVDNNNNNNSNNSNSTIISLNLTGNNSSFRTYLEIKESQDRLIVYIDTPVKIAKNQRAAVAEFLMRVNYNLVIGNFEIDFRDGEVRFRAAVDVEGSALSMEMVKTLVFVSASTADRFFPGIMSVCYGGKLPEDAYEELRNAPASTSSSPGKETSKSSSLQ
jgi:hypothetical protein